MFSLSISRALNTLKHLIEWAKNCPSLEIIYCSSKYIHWNGSIPPYSDPFSFITGRSLLRHEAPSRRLRDPRYCGRARPAGNTLLQLMCESFYCRLTYSLCVCVSVSLSLYFHAWISRKYCRESNLHIAHSIYIWSPSSIPSSCFPHARDPRAHGSSHKTSEICHTWK